MEKTETTAEPRSATASPQLIRQHQLDANLVKSYAVDFCGTKTLREVFVQRVMKRDGWQCQVCGSRQNLQVHHEQLRRLDSKSALPFGGDYETRDQGGQPGPAESLRHLLGRGDRFAEEGLRPKQLTGDA